MKAVVVLSGGMDSSTALSQAVAKHGKAQVACLTFNYGSKHNAKENVAASHIANKYGVQHTILSLPFIGQLFKSDLLKSGGAIPEGHYAESNMKKTVVPFRNGIMLAIAAGYAESIGAKTLVIGSHAGDHAVYPDCRDEFMIPFAEAVSKGTWVNIKLERPFEKMSKGEIVTLGLKLGTPYGMTWSCYKGGEKACGKCGTCVERLEAFDIAKAIDPIEYEDRIYYKTVLKTSPVQETPTEPQAPQSNQKSKKSPSRSAVSVSLAHTCKDA